MLSVILYGRNDAHGYNLHKRAALSLNAIARVLTEPSDEIIFVDYNTPEELPTFPETIADTLTAEAMRRIRVIRVRSAFHDQFTARTALKALEPQSRNIGIRRANPDNRWILSTNTDMIFVPERESDSLSSICADLPEGYFHLPRFEVPEGFWERASRLDPVGVMAAMRFYGKRYHLDEIVYGGFDNIYEGPGDFQLFLRDDLIAIAGFDERMILGWHADTNIARRMRLLRGRVDTAFPKLAGYHCGHTRQATGLHGARRTENDLTTYVREVRSAYWTDDPSQWGAPEETFEEFWLAEDRSLLYRAALDRAVPHAASGVAEAIYNETTFCEQGFEANHVLPHLADILFNAKGEQRLFMVATDPELIEGVSRFAEGVPLNMSTSLCSNAGLSEETPGAIPLATLEQGLAEAEIFLLQYPNPRTAPPATRRDQEWFVQHALERFVAVERQKPYSKRRRIIIVNGTHNLLQDTVNEHIDAAAMPYSSRLRHGRVIDALTGVHPISDPGSPDYEECVALGRSRSISPAERSLLGAALEGAPHFERLALELSVLAGREEWRSNGESRNAQAVRDRALSAIQDAEANAIAKPVALGPRVEHASRLCSGADWEDSAWADLAIRYFGERIYGLQERSRWVWERISLLHRLLLELPPGERPWVLLISEGPDPLAAMLAHQGYKVAYASVGELLGSEATDWRGELRVNGVVLPEDFVSFSQAPEGVAFEAVVASSGALFTRGEETFESLMQRIRGVMAPGGRFGASVSVHLNERRGGGALGYEEFRGAFGAGGVLRRQGISPDAPVDGRIPLDAVVKFAMCDEAGGGVPGLSFGFDEHARVTIGQLWGRFTERGQATWAPLAAGDVDMAFVAAMRERVIVWPALSPYARRNLIPFMLTDAQLKRSPGIVALASENGVVRFAVPLGLSSCAICVSIGLSQDLSPSSARANLVGESGAVFAGEITQGSEGWRVSFAPAPENSLLVLAFETHSIEWSALVAWLGGPFFESAS